MNCSGGKTKGLATLCVSGGMGMAMAIEAAVNA
jgi:acetyl-CoA acetyltransferase